MKPARHHTGEAAPMLIADLGAPDPKAAKLAGDALITIGSQALSALLDACDASPTAARRRVVFLLGRIPAPPSLRERVLRALHRALDDEDWKVRRNAAISLGSLAATQSAEPLFTRLEAESDPRVRQSLWLAIGKTADADALPRLRSLPVGEPPERDAAQKAAHSIEGRAGHRSRIHTASSLPSEVATELWTRHGVADIAAEEARSLGLDGTVITDDRVLIRSTRSFDTLMGVRTALFPVLVHEHGGSTASPSDLGREFDRSPVAAFMRQVTEAPVTYRLTVKLEDNAWPRRSEWISVFASACRLENRATAYAWEVIVRASRNAIVLGARPAAIADPRFGYRVSDVPASLHPTLAAAAVRLAPASANDVVVDPFCGAGTILAERAVLHPYRALHGIDVNARALAAARRNLTSFVDVTLRKADFSALADLRPIDMIVTNPPYGRRVGSAPEAKTLHRRLDDLATRALAPGGWLVVFRPLEFPAPTSLVVVSERTVDVGGFDVKLIAARKRK